MLLGTIEALPDIGAVEFPTQTRLQQEVECLGAIVGLIPRFAAKIWSSSGSADAPNVLQISRKPWQRAVKPFQNPPLAPIPPWFWTSDNFVMKREFVIARIAFSFMMLSCWAALWRVQTMQDL